MTSSPITSRQTEHVEAVTDFIFLGSKITADGDCSHEIKRCLLLRRKTMTNLDSILKRRNITLSTKVYIVKAMVFPVVIWLWELDHKEDWILQCDAFKLWCWRRLLKVPWTAKRSNQSIRKKISPEDSLEGLMLKSQYFGRHEKSWLIRKDPDAGKEGGKRRREWHRMRWLDSITDSMDMNLNVLWEIVEDERSLAC